MNRVTMLVLVVLLQWSAVVCAEEEAGKQQAAAELLNVMGLENVTMAGVNASLDLQLERNPALKPYRDVYLAWAKKYLTWETIGPQMAAVYAEAFTEPELRELIAFQKTPVGQKALRNMQELMQKGAQIGVQIAQAHSGELQQMIRERAEQLQQDSAQPKE